MNDKYLRVKEVAEFLGIGVSTVWLWTSLGKLPKPTRLSPRVTVWKQSDIQSFISEAVA